MKNCEKDICIIGGAGPEAGILLIKHIISIAQSDYGCKRDKDFPYIALFSFPFSEMLKDHDHNVVAKELSELITKECSKSKCWAIACNTLHCYLDANELPNTFVNLLDETCQFVTSTPVVLCSTTSRQKQIHRSYFPCEYPEDSLQPAVDQLIDDLVAHSPTEEMERVFRSIINTVGGRQVVLGCTEFSLINSFIKEPIAHVIDPLLVTAKKLCKIHFGDKNGSFRFSNN